MNYFMWFTLLRHRSHQLMLLIFKLIYCTLTIASLLRYMLLIICSYMIYALDYQPSQCLYYVIIRIPGAGVKIRIERNKGTGLAGNREHISQ